VLFGFFSTVIVSWAKCATAQKVWSLAEAPCVWMVCMAGAVQVRCLESRHELHQGEVGFYSLPTSSLEVWVHCKGVAVWLAAFLSPGVKSVHSRDRQRCLAKQAQFREAVNVEQAKTRDEARQQYLQHWYKQRMGSRKRPASATLVCQEPSSHNPGDGVAMAQTPSVAMTRPPGSGRELPTRQWLLCHP
jgi:hypothetical protein